MARGKRDGQAAARPYRELTDAALVEAMRRGDERTLDEFILRFEPFLRERGRRAGLRPRDAETLVLEVLEDVGGLILAGRTRPRGSLASYLFVAFRNRCSAAAREDGAREEALRRVAEESPGGLDAVGAACSESSIRASLGPDWRPGAISPVLARLAHRIEHETDEEERRVLSWLGHYVPQRQIAEWLGISYGAATQRIWRLRARLRVLALRFADELEQPERRELMRFLRRSEADDAPARRRRMKAEAGAASAARGGDGRADSGKEESNDARS